MSDEAKLIRKLLEFRRAVDRLGIEIYMDGHDGEVGMKMDGEVIISGDDDIYLINTETINEVMMERVNALKVEDA